MRVCDVVLNSVWHDPRVTKQINEYLRNGIEVVCVGMRCKRYDENKINSMPCRVVIVERNAIYGGKQKSIIKKLLREKYRIESVVDAIVSQKPDIIHANDLDALIPAYYAMRKLGCRLIYDSHEINCENRMYDKYWLYNQLMKWQERRIVKKCDMMICVSNAAANYFSELYHIKKPIVVTNCILKDDLIYENQVKHEGFEVLNHGIFHDSRGLEMMLDSCEYMKRFEDIKMVARGYGGIEKELKNKVCSNGYDNFIFYPPVDPKKLICEASRSHVGVAVTLPVCLNFELSVSNRLFEYAAAGLPVILSDIPEHRLLNEKYMFGLIIENNSQEEFNKAVIKLHSNRELYMKLSENSKRMSKEMCWEQQFTPIIDYIKNISANGDIK